MDYKKITNAFKGFIIKHKVVAFIVILITAIYVGFYLFSARHYTYITAEFSDYHAPKNRLDVYYNGIKIGHVLSVKISDDFKNTLVRFVLYPPNLKLPKNITANMKKEKNKKKDRDFIELVYPETPSAEILKSGDVIKGIPSIDVENFIANQSPEFLNQVKNNMNQTMEDAQNTLNSLSDLFVVIQDVIKENRPVILEITKNFAATSGNLRDVSLKLNIALTQQRLNNTFNGIEVSTANISDVTQNVKDVTLGIGIATDAYNQNILPPINDTILELNCIMKNINEITCGISQTLKKNMGGARLIFGKTIDEECCCSTCKEKRKNYKDTAKAKKQPVLKPKAVSKP